MGGIDKKYTVLSHLTEKISLFIWQSCCRSASAKRTVATSLEDTYQ